MYTWPIKFLNNWKNGRPFQFFLFCTLQPGLWFNTSDINRRYPPPHIHTHLHRHTVTLAMLHGISNQTSIIASDLELTTHQILLLYSNTTIGLPAVYHEPIERSRAARRRRKPKPTANQLHRLHMRKTHKAGWKKTFMSVSYTP